MSAQPLELAAGDAHAVVLPEAGGRLGSLRIGGRELLVTDSSGGPMSWGSYPMAPWAGRIANGRFRFDGRDHRLPLGYPPHAIHGVVYDRPWSVTGEAEVSIELDDRWPFRGRVVESFALREDGLDVTLRLVADEPMPATVGWHPWFRRSLGEGAPVRLSFDAGTMLLRGADGIPTGERVPPSVGPWDDAFTDVAADPVLEWPGQLRLTISTTCAWWVVYTEPEHALCVEPQSGPPDALNSSPEAVVPGRPMTHVMRWRWERLG